MNSRNAQLWPPRRTGSRVRLLIASAVMAACFGAGADAAHAGVSFGNDIAPPTLPGGQQQALLLDPAVIYGSGFQTLAFGFRPQAREAYTLRLVGSASEPLRGPAEFVAAQIAAISGVSITVAPGHAVYTVPDRVPARGEILLSADASSPCSITAPEAWVGCGGPEDLFYDGNVVKLQAGRIWIEPTVLTYAYSADIRDVVAHEIGHVLGLGHRDDYYHGEFQVMRSTDDGNTRGYYRDGDANGIRYVSPPISPPASQFSLRNANTTGPVQLSFVYGNTGDIPLKGDWDGNGADTPGVYRPSTATFYLKNGAGVPDLTIQYGNIGDTPITGDFNGDGIDTVGVRRGGTWWLRSSAPGIPEISFGYGNTGDIPLTGDWDGNGTDTQGVYRPSTATFYLHNGPGLAEFTIQYGNIGDTPITGDWDGNGTDTIGVRRLGTWYLRNQNSPGTPNTIAEFGNTTDKPLPGDWDGNDSGSHGNDTLGVYR